MTESRAGHGCPTSYVNRLKHVIVAGEGYEYSKNWIRLKHSREKKWTLQILKVFGVYYWKK